MKIKQMTLTSGVTEGSVWPHMPAHFLVKGKISKKLKHPVIFFFP